MTAGGASVSLVIPGRNAARTAEPCLEAVVPLLGRHGLGEILFVDDGSTDSTAQIAGRYPVRLVAGGGRGPGAARNRGWEAASGTLVWFIDSDCVAEPEALPALLAQLVDPRVAGAGGSYANLRPGSLLACLIHEEIVARHRVMPADTDFLGGFNVLYRRTVLAEVGGFDEGEFNGPGSPGAEDAELAFRIRQAGHALRFEPRSRVGHFHPTRLDRYLRSQLHHGRWRVSLYLRHRGKWRGDAYSGLADHLQPPLAMVLLALLPTLAWPSLRPVVPLLALALVALQVPMTLRLVGRTRRARHLWFAPLGFLRAFARGLGLTWGVLARLARTSGGVR